MRKGEITMKKSLKQIVTAVSDGAIAATSAIKYLQKIKFNKNKYF